MSDCRRQWNREDELPVYLAGPVSTGPNKRKSYGMFSSVEGAFESKTIDFDNYAVERKGSRTPRSGSRERLLDTGDPIGKTPSEAREGSLTNSPGERDDGRPGVEIRHSFGKESPDGKVYSIIMIYSVCSVMYEHDKYNRLHITCNHKKRPWTTAGGDIAIFRERTKNISLND